ncbi:hypothetical protein Sjap_003010 [Stephania japonica]|uniref:Uncharacterized protein n=1 Tax=Stephania japonica TaxID=461633 RepID=A0AAP0PUN5_9MAGN
MRQGRGSARVMKMMMQPIEGGAVEVLEVAAIVIVDGGVAIEVLEVEEPLPQDLIRSVSLGPKSNQICVGLAVDLV